MSSETKWSVGANKELVVRNRRLLLQLIRISFSIFMIAAIASEVTAAALSGQGKASQLLSDIRKAAEGGDALAQFYLAEIYERGIGVPQDCSEAAKWYRKAAEQGEPVAQLGLANLCLRGEGVTQDYVQAYRWLNVAAAQVHTKAANQSEVLKSNMSGEQIAEAQRLFQGFRPGVGSEAKAERDKPASAPEKATVVKTGTGFFITEDGYLVTNAHVVEDGGIFKVTTVRGSWPARLVKCDVADDLAVLKVEGSQSALPLQSSRSVRLGQSVATVGYPNVDLQGFLPKVARGEIASLAGEQDNPRHFQISVPVQPGNSGGPLIDLRGNVVGVVKSQLDQAVAFERSGSLPENVNYAIKSGFLLSFLESLPDISGHLREPSSREMIFEDVIAMVEKSTVLVLVYR
jgi:hypothetical protein